MPHDIDMSRLVRRQPDMSREALKKTATNYLTDCNVLYRVATAELRERGVTGELCVDAVDKPGWVSKSFRQKVDTLVDDTLFWHTSL